MLKSIQFLWKSWWLYGAFGIVALILWNTNVLFQLLKQEERTKMELWVAAQQELIESTDLSRDYGPLAFDVLQKNGITPMIQVDEHDQIVDFKNIAWTATDDPDSLKLYAILDQLKQNNRPLPIRYKDIVDQRLYYGDSPLLLKLQYYPLALLLIIFLFGGLLYFVFQTTKAAEQNRLWAGMAKETAHQIGTPLSSLMGWIALLKEDQNTPSAIPEMEKDIARLDVITERFSKVGSLPELTTVDVLPLIKDTLHYLEKRSGKQVKWIKDLPESSIRLPVNPPLLSWTVENVIKNGLDAMKGVGTLTVSVLERQKEISLNISDTGSGINPQDLKAVFQPGFTTKSRGWGLGLSLARRIVEDYHNGQIQVKTTRLGQGTTFEIVLPK